MRNKRRTPRVLSVEKALRILGLFSEVDLQLGITAVSRQLAMPKSIVARLMLTLDHHQFLQQDGERGTYRIGPRLFQLGALYVRNFSLVERAEPVLEAAMRASECTAQLMVRDGDEALIVGSRESSAVVRVAARLGSRLPLHATASGKAIMAQWRQAELEAFLRRGPLRRYTATTITSPRRLLQELEAVRRAGVATQNQEYTPEVFAVSAPLPPGFGGREAAIAVSTTPAHATPREVRRLGATVLDAVAELAGPAEAASRSGR